MNTVDEIVGVKRHDQKHEKLLTNEQKSSGEYEESNLTLSLEKTRREWLAKQMSIDDNTLKEPPAHHYHSHFKVSKEKSSPLLGTQQPPQQLTSSLATTTTAATLHSIYHSKQTTP